MINLIICLISTFFYETLHMLVYININNTYQYVLTCKKSFIIKEWLKLFAGNAGK